MRRSVAPVTVRVIGVKPLLLATLTVMLELKLPERLITSMALMCRSSADALAIVTLS